VDLENLLEDRVFMNILALFHDLSGHADQRS
jgi:hypothetical protein